MKATSRREKLTRVMESCPIYGITGGNRDVVPLVKDMLSAGIRIIQYREKHKTLLIIDDYVDLALAVHADGVHVGQDDLPPNTVRRIVGSDMLIGWSTHSINDLKCANRYQNIIDYIGVGPVFSTQTKPNAHPVGISYVHWAKQFSKLPIVAIGGIKTSNVESVWNAHPDFICAVSEITDSPNMQETIYELLSEYVNVR